MLDEGLDGSQALIYSQYCYWYTLPNAQHQHKGH
jgi:hypothetical protein